MQHARRVLEFLLSATSIRVTGFKSSGDSMSRRGLYAVDSEKSAKCQTRQVAFPKSPIHADSCRSALTYALPLCNTETHALVFALGWSLSRMSQDSCLKQSSYSAAQDMRESGGFNTHNGKRGFHT